MYMLWYLSRAFGLASLISIPAVLLNMQGDNLVDIGITSRYYTAILSYAASLANVRPWERSSWYPVYDTLVILILAISFAAVYRVTQEIEQAVDEGQVPREIAHEICMHACSPAQPTSR